MGFFDLSKKRSNSSVDKELLRLNKAIAAQNKQLAMIQSAENKYERDGNIDSLISFWESIWDKGGLLFNGSKWTFRLPDLYIKTKQYEKALSILKKIKDPQYADKKSKYIAKIKNTKNKIGG